MQRDMSYDLDDVFAGRNAGELLTEEVTKTRVLRTPGLRVLPAPHAQNLDPRMDQSLSNPLGRSLSNGIDTVPNDLAGLLDGDINLPIVGAVSKKQLAIGAVAGLALWFLVLRRR
jgi:hypothetical protein